MLIGLLFAITGEPSVGEAAFRSTLRRVCEERMMTGWAFKRVPIAEDPTSFRLVPETRTYSCSVCRPVDVGAGQTVMPLWQQMVNGFIAQSEYLNAVEFVASLRDDVEKADALAFVVASIGWKRSPWPEYVPQTVSFMTAAPEPVVAAPPDQTLLDGRKADGIDDAIQQKAIQEFVAATRKELAASLTIARTIDDHGGRARVLMNIANVQYSLGDATDSRQTQTEAESAFEKYQQGEHSIWAWLKGAFALMIEWGIKLGLTTAIAGVIAKITTFCLVESIVRGINNEKFAKALGTTLKVAAKESALIIPVGAMSHQKE